MLVLHKGKACLLFEVRVEHFWFIDIYIDVFAVLTTSPSTRFMPLALENSQLGLAVRNLVLVAKMAKRIVVQNESGFWPG